MPTWPSLHGCFAIHSISVAASAPSCTYGTVASGLHAFPRVNPMTAA
jgi:hypothetical protein